MEFVTASELADSMGVPVTEIIRVCLELNHEVGDAFTGVGGELFDALHLAQLELHGHDQQALTIFRGDPLVHDTDDEERHFDVRIVLHRNGVVGNQTGTYSRSAPSTRRTNHAFPQMSCRGFRGSVRSVRPDH